MRVTHYRYIIVILVSAFAAAAGGRLPPSVAHDDKPQRAASPHVHPAVPASYAAMTAPQDIWTNPAVLARGQAIHAAKCAICHGREGDGDGPAVAGQAVKPASLRDRAMVAEMT